jgi:hypothetical protein
MDVRQLAKRDGDEKCFAEASGTQEDAEGVRAVHILC